MPRRRTASGRRREKISRSEKRSLASVPIDRSLGLLRSGHTEADVALAAAAKEVVGDQAAVIRWAHEAGDRWITLRPVEDRFPEEPSGERVERQNAYQAAREQQRRIAVAGRQMVTARSKPGA